MKTAKQFLRRSAAFLLAASLLCTAALAAEPEKTTAEQRREDLEFLDYRGPGAVARYEKGH